MSDQHIDPDIATALKLRAQGRSGITPEIIKALRQKASQATPDTRYSGAAAAIKPSIDEHNRRQAATTRVVGNHGQSRLYAARLKEMGISPEEAKGKTTGQLQALSERKARQQRQVQSQALVNQQIAANRGAFQHPAGSPLPSLGPKDDRNIMHMTVAKMTGISPQQAAQAIDEVSGAPGGGAKLLESLADPANVALITLIPGLNPAVQKIVSGYFAYQMGNGSVEASRSINPGLWERIKSGKVTGDDYKKLTVAAGSGVMAGLAGAHFTGADTAVINKVSGTKLGKAISEHFPTVARNLDRPSSKAPSAVSAFLAKRVNDYRAERSLRQVKPGEPTITTGKGTFSLEKMRSLPPERLKKFGIEGGLGEPAKPVEHPPVAAEGNDKPVKLEAKLNRPGSTKADTKSTSTARRKAAAKVAKPDLETEETAAKPTATQPQPNISNTARLPGETPQQHLDRLHALLSHMRDVSDEVNRDISYGTRRDTEAGQKALDKELLDISNAYDDARESYGLAMFGSPEDHASAREPQEGPANASSKPAEVPPGQGVADTTPTPKPKKTRTEKPDIDLEGMGEGMGEAIRRSWRESVARTGRLPQAEQGSIAGQAWTKLIQAGHAPADAIEAFIEKAKAGGFNTIEAAKKSLSELHRDLSEAKRNADNTNMLSTSLSNLAKKVAGKVNEILDVYGGNRMRLDTMYQEARDRKLIPTDTTQDQFVKSIRNSEPHTDEYHIQNGVVIRGKNPKGRVKPAAKSETPPPAPETESKPAAKKTTRVVTKPDLDTEETPEPEPPAGTGKADTQAIEEERVKADAKKRAEREAEIAAAAGKADKPEKPATQTMLETLFNGRENKNFMSIEQAHREAKKAGLIPAKMTQQEFAQMMYDMDENSHTFIAKAAQSAEGSAKTKGFKVKGEFGEETIHNIYDRGYRDPKPEPEADKKPETKPAATSQIDKLNDRQRNAYKGLNNGAALWDIAEVQGGKALLRPASRTGAGKIIHEDGSISSFERWADAKQEFNKLAKPAATTRVVTKPDLDAEDTPEPAPSKVDATKPKSRSDRQKVAEKILDEVVPSRMVAALKKIGADTRGVERVVKRSEQAAARGDTDTDFSQEVMNAAEEALDEWVNEGQEEDLKPLRKGSNAWKYDQEQQALVGKRVSSYGGGTDRVLNVERVGDGQYGYKYTVRDEQTGQVRTHQTPIDPHQVLPETTAASPRSKTNKQAGLLNLGPGAPGSPSARFHEAMSERFAGVRNNIREGASNLRELYKAGLTHSYNAVVRASSSHAIANEHVEYWVPKVLEKIKSADDQKRLQPYAIFDRAISNYLKVTADYHGARIMQQQAAQMYAKTGNVLYEKQAEALGKRAKALKKHLSDSVITRNSLAKGKTLNDPVTGKPITESDVRAYFRQADVKKALGVINDPNGIKKLLEENYNYAGRPASGDKGYYSQTFLPAITLDPRGNAVSEASFGGRKAPLHDSPSEPGKRQALFSADAYEMDFRTALASRLASGERAKNIYNMWKAMEKDGTVAATRIQGTLKNGKPSKRVQDMVDNPNYNRATGEILVNGKWEKATSPFAIQSKVAPNVAQGAKYSSLPTEVVMPVRIYNEIEPLFYRPNMAPYEDVTNRLASTAIAANLTGLGEAGAHGRSLASRLGKIIPVIDKFGKVGKFVQTGPLTTVNSASHFLVNILAGRKRFTDDMYHEAALAAAEAGALPSQRLKLDKVRGAASAKQAAGALARNTMKLGGNILYGEKGMLANAHVTIHQYYKRAGLLNDPAAVFQMHEDMRFMNTHAEVLQTNFAKSRKGLVKLTGTYAQTGTLNRTAAWRGGAGMYFARAAGTVAMFSALTKARDKEHRWPWQIPGTIVGDFFLGTDDKNRTISIDALQFMDRSEAYGMEFMNSWMRSYVEGEKTPVLINRLVAVEMNKVAGPAFSGPVRGLEEGTGYHPSYWTVNEKNNIRPYEEEPQKRMTNLANLPEDLRWRVLPFVKGVASMLWVADPTDFSITVPVEERVDTVWNMLSWQNANRILKFAGLPQAKARLLDSKARKLARVKNREFKQAERMKKRELHQHGFRE